MANPLNSFHLVQPRGPDPNHGHKESPAGVDACDRSLVRRAQSGDGKAFDQLVLKYRFRLMNLVLRYTHSYSDAEDAVQEACIRAYCGLQHFRRECTFHTWLYRIAINCAKNVLRARRRAPVVSTFELPNADDVVGNPAYLQELDTPEGLSFTDDVRDAVNAALNELPEGHRTAILLREVEGLTYEKIAVAMATPVGTVRSRIFRARNTIDQQLRQVFDGGLGRHGKRRRSAAGAA